ncbi:MAG: ATP-dependent zinc metalloprotease FtsH [Defluviitaleaceae bacterium]|nr:ATP-dependent zinc metalloprotease FtsH [Defluviitaleaceae bacterium]
MKPNDNNQKKPNKNNEPGTGFNIFHFLFIGLVLTVLINMFTTNTAPTTLHNITYDQFLRLLSIGSVSDVEIQPTRLLISLRDDLSSETVTEVILALENINIAYEDIANREAGDTYTYPPAPPEPAEPIATSPLAQAQTNLFGPATAAAAQPIERLFYTGNVNDPNLVERLIEAQVSYHAPIVENNFLLQFVLSWVLPLAFFYLIITLFMRRMSKGLGGGFGKSNAKMYDMEKKTGITFEDVAGQEEAKESLQEIVDFLHGPEKYTRIGAVQPKGALLVGPPGTGKTLLAKAVAGEANVAFFSLSGSEFVEMYVGVGASRVRDLFKQAHSNAPCIIFIDEIDAIGKSRDSKMGGGNDEREQTLNQLLAEMDGFDTSRGIMILAATNRPEILDKALLRPGRFDRRIIVEKPDLPGRESILTVHAKKVKMDSDVDIKKIALATSGAAGADLANMINEAALRAVRLGRKVVKQEDLMEAVEVVIAGKEKKDRILSPKEKRLVAFHEIGHALAAALQKNAQPVQKITIVPRTMGSLGYVMQMPEEEKYLMEKDELIAQIVVMLSGRAAEEVVFNTQTTGASNDIERATKMARSMVTQYGMSEKFGMMGLESIENRYLDGRAVLNASDPTGAEVDKEVQNIIESCYAKAKELLEQNRIALDSISEFLIKKETVTGEEFMDILRKYVHIPTQAEKEMAIAI